jgi:hypothetical protein
MLQGRIIYPVHRFIDAHAIKFANRLHTSLSSLVKRNPTWEKHHSTSHINPLSPPCAQCERSPLPPQSANNHISQYQIDYRSHTHTCPACQKHLTFEEYINTPLHLLTACTHPDIQKQLTTLHTNLGERLTAIGAPQWWLEKPAPPFPKTLDLPLEQIPPHHLPLWTSLTAEAKRDDHHLTIPLVLPTTKPRHLAAAYLHTLLQHTPLIQTSAIETLIHHTAPPRTHLILHPAIISAAVSTLTITHHFYCNPPFLHPDIKHFLSDPLNPTPPIIPPVTDLAWEQRPHEALPPSQPKTQTP